MSVSLPEDQSVRSSLSDARLGCSQGSGLQQNSRFATRLGSVTGPVRCLGLSGIWWVTEGNSTTAPAETCQPPYHQSGKAVTGVRDSSPRCLAHPLVFLSTIELFKMWNNQLVLNRTPVPCHDAPWSLDTLLVDTLITLHHECQAFIYPDMQRTSCASYHPFTPNYPSSMYNWTIFELCT